MCTAPTVDAYENGVVQPGTAKCATFDITKTMKLTDVLRVRFGEICDTLPLGLIRGA